MEGIVRLIEYVKAGLLVASETTSTVDKTEKKISQLMETYLHWVDLLKNWLIQHGIGASYAEMFKILIVFAVIALLAILADIITKRIILSIVYKVAKRTETIFDDILVEKKVFHRLAHLAPAIVVYYTIGIPLADFPGFLAFLFDVTQVYMILVSLMTILAFIDAVQAMYLTLPLSKNHSIKGYLQVVKIILYFFAGIFIISAVNDTSPTALLGGLAAMAAVLMFVFKDTILGLVASIQLSVNDMLRPGDWIEMPNRKADGVVQDISLTTIKVQNWDKTITTIPTYSLVADSFTNWRGMEEAEGRRIKRAIPIDMNSIRFYSDGLLQNLTENSIVTRNFDVKKYISENLDPGNIEQRTLTNLGIFRAYMEAYLKNVPAIHNEMTLLVHSLQPSENGLPLEIIVFSKEKAGKAFEKIQSEIIDHMLAVLPEFELKVFQRPTGDDFMR
jgi:miniconductance mechanosensitive channel